jgi:hypothetical protein
MRGVAIGRKKSSLRGPMPVVGMPGDVLESKQQNSMASIRGSISPTPSRTIADHPAKRLAELLSWSWQPACPSEPLTEPG